MRLLVPEGREYLIHGRTYRAGDEFDAPEKEGALWLATGLACRPRAGQLRLETEAMEPFKRGPGRPRKSETKEPALYERKDMRAVDDE